MHNMLHVMVSQQNHFLIPLLHIINMLALYTPMWQTDITKTLIL